MPAVGNWQAAWHDKRKNAEAEMLAERWEMMHWEMMPEEAKGQGCRLHRDKHTPASSPQGWGDQLQREAASGSRSCTEVEFARSLLIPLRDTF